MGRWAAGLESNKMDRIRDGLNSLMSGQDEGSLTSITEASRKIHCRPEKIIRALAAPIVNEMGWRVEIHKSKAGTYLRRAAIEREASPPDRSLDQSQVMLEALYPHLRMNMAEKLQIYRRILGVGEVGHW